MEGLRLSLEHTKGRFEDSAFYVEFFHRHLRELTNASSPVSVSLRDYYQFESGALSRELRKITERVEAGLDPLAIEPTTGWRQTSRKGVRVHYPEPPWSEPIEKQVELLVLSMKGYEQPISIRKQFREKRLPTDERLKHFGGMEYDLVRLFKSLAIHALEQGDVNSAISLAATDVRHRDAGDRLLLAYLNACAGNRTEAYGQIADTWSSGQHLGFTRFDGHLGEAGR